MNVNERKKIELGDFQTPKELTDQICSLICELNQNPKIVIEPTCGKGNFLLSAMNFFSDCEEFIGIDINKNYINYLASKIPEDFLLKTKLKAADVFSFDWLSIIKNSDSHILVLGNPPWVTNSQMGTIDGSNLPIKSNIHMNNGISAITGKSNFDISEWLILHLIKTLKSYNTTIALLIKTSVARKLLKYCWINNLPIKSAKIFRIDSKKHFNISADSCMFYLEFGQIKLEKTCKVYSNLSLQSIGSTIGFSKNDLTANIEGYQKLKYLEGKSQHYKWRSGVKHDCSNIMELTKVDSKWRNGLGELIELEANYVYPLLKSSHLYNFDGDINSPEKWVIITQQKTGEDTSFIQLTAPKLWKYLQSHTEVLFNRKSLIYAKAPQFSIFGIGVYSFTKWKVAISGFYKTIHFKVIPPLNDKPVMVDDTCYYIPCETKEEAIFIQELLTSEISLEFLNSIVFWDNKRPITVEVLNRINIEKIAFELDRVQEYDKFNNQKYNSYEEQLSLFN
ncbi:MAG: N-6 DNA methylase [bacterium]